MKKFVILAVCGVAGLAGILWVLVLDQNKTQEKVSNLPTRVELYNQAVKAAQSRRQICRGVNKRFIVLQHVVAQQRPDPSTTAYYRDHPDEFQRAKEDFNKTIKALGPINCERTYPAPKFKDFDIPPPKTKVHARQPKYELPTATTPNNSYAPPRPKTPTAQPYPRGPTARVRIPRRPPIPRPPTTPVPRPPAPSPPVSSAPLPPQPSPPLTTTPPVPPPPRPPILPPVCQLNPILPVC